MYFQIIFTWLLVIFEMGKGFADQKDEQIDLLKIEREEIAAETESLREELIYGYKVICRLVLLLLKLFNILVI